MKPRQLILIKRWLDIKTNITSIIEGDSLYSLQGHKQLAIPEQELRKHLIDFASHLWFSELDFIPVNEDDELVFAWNLKRWGFPSFEKGTDRQAIWHWFENTFDLSIAEDILQLKTQTT